MHRDGSQVELLRIILENTLQPQRLDTHPWTRSLIVIEAGANTPDLHDEEPWPTAGDRDHEIIQANDAIHATAAREAPGYTLGGIRYTGSPVFFTVPIWRTIACIVTGCVGIHR